MWGSWSGHPGENTYLTLSPREERRAADGVRESSWLMRSRSFPVWKKDPAFSSSPSKREQPEDLFHDLYLLPTFTPILAQWPSFFGNITIVQVSSWMNISQCCHGGQPYVLWNHLNYALSIHIQQSNQDREQVENGSCMWSTYILITPWKKVASFFE